MKKILLFMVMGIFMLSLISAYIPHGVGENLTFSFSDDIATTCNITTMDSPDGTVWINQTMGVSDSTFSGSINSGNFSTLGTYCFNIACDDGYGSVCRELTPNGENSDESKLDLSKALITLLVLFFIIALVLFFKNEHYIAKFVFYWVCHVLLIAISFISWQTANNYLTMDGGVAGIFKIMFYVFTVSAFPMVLMSIVWVFYIHTFNEHIDKLISKGIRPEEAFRMTERKKGGWFNGK